MVRGATACRIASESALRVFEKIFLLSTKAFFGKYKIWRLYSMATVSGSCFYLFEKFTEILTFFFLKIYNIWHLNWACSSDHKWFVIILIMSNVFEFECHLMALSNDSRITVSLHYNRIPYFWKKQIEIGNLQNLGRKNYFADELSKCIDESC